MSRENSEIGPRHVNGFDLETPYEGAGRLAWHSFLETLDVQSACRLCGIDHFPHWLASSANWQLLIEYLSKNYPKDMPVRQVLCLAIKERRPDPHSEEAAWWKAMEHVIPDLERFAFLYCYGLIRPQSEAMFEEGICAMSDGDAQAVIVM
jgi:hypothetical protein